MGYAQYYPIVMRTITLPTKHVGTLENYTQSNNITKSLTELYQAIEVMERTNVIIVFANIRTSKPTYYLVYDKSQSKDTYI